MASAKPLSVRPVLYLLGINFVCSEIVSAVLEVQSDEAACHPTEVRVEQLWWKAVVRRPLCPHQLLKVLLSHF